MRTFLSQATVLLLVTFLSILEFSGCSTSKPSENVELKRSLYKLTKHFPEFDDIIVFSDAVVEDDAIVVYTTLDKDFYGSKVAQGLKEIWADNDWKEEFKEKMVIKHSHLINLAKSAEIDMCWRFYDKKPGDGFDIRLNSEEAKKIIALTNEKNSLSEIAHNKLNAFIKEINYSLPENRGDGLSLNNVELQPNLIVYNFEVDESITSHKKLEGEIIWIGKSKMSSILQNGIVGDSLLLTAADAGVGITYRFKGSKTGYTQDYEVLTLKELKNLKAALD